MECHFTELVGKPLLQTMSDSYVSKVPRLMSFFSECKKKEVVSTFCEISAANIRKNSPEVLGIVSLLSAYFGETVDSLIITKDVKYIVCH